VLTTESLGPRKSALVHAPAKRAFKSCFSSFSCQSTLTADGTWKIQPTGWVHQDRASDAIYLFVALEMLSRFLFAPGQRLKNYFVFVGANEMPQKPLWVPLVNESHKCASVSAA
jgi:hypothetical protein